MTNQNEPQDTTQLASSDTRFARVFSPLSVGANHTMKNRLYFPSFGADLADPSGEASAELIDFYRKIIDGGCGFMLLGNSSVESTSRLQERGLALFNQAHADSLIPLLEYGEANNCAVGLQLQHYGAQGSTEFTCKPLLSPSGVPCKRMQKYDPNYRLKIMDDTDIQDVIEQFTHSAELAWKAGARLIQIQASNGYLLSSFLSPYTNHRTDAYGGDEKKRARLLLEVVESIHQRTKGELTVCVRLNIDDAIGAAGQQPELLAHAVGMFEDAGIHGIECSMGIGEVVHIITSAGPDTDGTMLDGFLSSVSTIRSFTKLPIGFAGSIKSVARAEEILAKGIVDFVGMGRALFADNDLITKTLTGHERQIHQCRFEGNCFRDKANPNFERVYCCVNPRYLRPIEYD